MAKFALEFDDYQQLLALHRALMEAKFCTVPNDTAVSGSPLVADLANQVVDALSGWKNGSDETWTAWRRIDDGRREWVIAQDRACETASAWRALDRPTKVELATNLLGPFKANPDQIELFLSEVDRRCG